MRNASTKEIIITFYHFVIGVFNTGTFLDIGNECFEDFINLIFNIFLNYTSRCKIKIYNKI